jgi:OOP family OmpA-OmpF porin
MKWSVLLIVIILLGHQLTAQRILSENRKANKFFEQGQKLQIARKFEEAIQKYNLAIQKDSSIAEAYFQAGAAYSILLEEDSAMVYYEELALRFAEEPRYAGAHLRLSEYNFSKGNYDIALQQSNKFLSLRENEDRYSRRANSIKTNCEFALNRIDNPLKFNPRPLPYPINQFQQQYFPVLSADQKELFYIKRDESEEIYTSKRKIGGDWSIPVPIDSSLTTEYNEGTCSVSADGRTMVFTSCMRDDGFGSCDLYITQKIGGKWSVPVNIGRPVNSSAWDSQPSLAADGRTLYFVSNRKGGLGLRDIWVTQRKANNKWSMPKNLGPAINSEEDDISPFIHVNDQILYFSTNARPGFGGFDIYYSERIPEKGWGEPINFGYPINTMNDEVAMFITSDGAAGYYSYETVVDNKLESKLYQIDIPEEISIKNRSSFITGIVYDSLTKAPIKAKVQLYNLTQDELNSEVSSDSLTGEYLMVLTEGADYALYVDAPNYLFKSYHFDFSIDSLNLEGLSADIALKRIERGDKTTLNNVLFELDSYQLSRKSAAALIFIKTYLTNHPEILAEIAGHTDNQGNDDYNLNLSLMRAQTVYNYLVETGIDPNRLFFKGYGSKEPVASNDSPEGRALNRRIELRILE